MDRFARIVSRTVAILLGSLAVQSSPAFALDPARRITQYGLDIWLTRDGLPQNSVRTIVQTRDGYLWLGTRGGLARFDGVRFTIFNRANTPGLHDSRITALAEGSDGSLWIGTASGGVVQYKSGAFTTFRSEGDTSYEERSRWQIRAIAPGRDGTLWIGTSGGGFRRLKNGRFSPLLMDRHVVEAILEDRSGRLWVGTGDDLVELTWIEPDHFEVRRRLLPGSRRVSAIHQDQAGVIWVAGRDGLTRVAGDRVTTFGASAGFPHDGAVSLAGDRDGNLWIGTNGGGLVRMRGEHFDTLTVRDGLSNGFIPSLYEDREGSLWIGSNDGLNRLRDTRFTTITAREGLSADATSSLLAGRDGSLWVGTQGGGLNRVYQGAITSFTTARGLPSNYVGALFEAHDGSIWITGDSAVMRLDRGKLRTYTTRDGVPKGFVSTVAEDRQGRLIIGGEGPIRELVRDRFEVYAQQPSHIEYCYSITRDRFGDLWFATTGGLVHVQNGGHRLYTTRDGLPDEGVHSIYMDSAGTVWIATVSGLARLKNGTITSFAKVGPLGEVVFEILEDDAGNLWMNGRQGILKASRRELETYAGGSRDNNVPITIYGLADGMKSSEYDNAYIQRPACRTPDGRLWFATTHGVAAIDPSMDWANRLPPPLVIEAVVADERLPGRSPLQLAAGTSAFDIEYTALSFVAPSRVRFAYRLEGLDGTWVDAGTRRVASFTRVPPGRYRFRVRAANNDGVWNESGAVLDIHVPPRFYQTVWFSGSLLALFALSAMGLHRMRMRRVEARFAVVMRERNRIAREIHDTLAQGLVGIGLHLSAMQQNEATSERDRHVETARRLVESSLAEAHRSVWDLHPQYLDHSTLIGGLERMAADISEAASVQIAVRTRGIARSLGTDVERNVFRVAQEAVANAIRHGGAHRIEVALGFDVEELQLSVTDDGCGFDPSVAAASGGFGLTSMRERAEQIGGALRVESRPTEGTSITLTVPAASSERGRIASWLAARWRTSD